MADGNGAQALGHVRVRRDGHVGEVVLDNPARRNPLSLAVMRDLIARIGAFGADPAVRVIVIVGTPPAFSAGHDLAEMTGRSDEFYGELFEVCCELMATIRDVPQPVVAAVDGIATAAGCQVVAACDLVVATEGSRFATPGVRIGLFCSVPMVPLSRAIGRKRAMEMLLTGEAIDAAAALAFGLVNRVVDDDALEDAALALARRIAGHSPLTIAIGKRAFYAQIDRGLDDAYDLATDAMTRNMLARDAEEGIDAFLEKRTPQWEGR